MRRYREMSALNGGMNFYGSLPESYTITVNYNHPLIKRILKEKTDSISGKINDIEDRVKEPAARLEEINKDIKDKKEDQIESVVKEEKQSLEESLDKIKDERRELLKDFGKGNDLVEEVADLALLANGMLKGAELNKFIKRSLKLIK